MSFSGEEEPVEFDSFKRCVSLGEPGTETEDGPVTAVSDTMADLSDFQGHVVAWCFGERPEVLRGGNAEFKLEVPDLGRNVPALIGLGSSSAEVVDGKERLLDPIVTCLAQAGETFDPPLRLRFPVEDGGSEESGFCCGAFGDANASYRAHLQSTFSAWTREAGSARWVPIDGVVKEMDGGEFVLEVTVRHFCAFALAQDVHVGAGGTEVFPLPSLVTNSRPSHFHFVNLGTEHLVIYCWGAARKRGFLEYFRVKLGLGATTADVEVEGRRAVVDVSGTKLEMVQVLGKAEGEPRNVACLVVAGQESLTVVHTTQETSQRLMGSSHTVVQVWGRRSMRHKNAMVFAP